MTRDDLKAAFMEACPIIHNGITYKRVFGLIYRKNPAGSGLIVRAELLDKNENAITVAPPERIERADKPGGDQTERRESR